MRSVLRLSHARTVTGRFEAEIPGGVDMVEVVVDFGIGMVAGSTRHIPRGVMVAPVFLVHLVLVRI